MALLQCRFMIQRNVSQGDSTSNGMMRMHAIDCILLSTLCLVYLEDDDLDKLMNMKISPRSMLRWITS
jgi:hypothetical protein